MHGLKDKLIGLVSWPYRKYDLEVQITDYLMACRRNFRDKHARQEARQVILSGPNNPWNS